MELGTLLGTLLGTALGTSLMLLTQDGRTEGEALG
jgi:hypothetical protein